MNLKIKDFGVIKNADIKVDGITVITGNNNFLEELNSKLYLKHGLDNKNIQTVFLVWNIIRTLLP